MSSSSAVPQITFGPNGFIVPQESAILAGVTADINAAFGGAVNPALETPQGQLASSEAAMLAASNDAFLYVSQQFDPAYAEGRYQDALARIYFLTRNPAQPTVVQGVVSGAVGVVVPPGYQVRSVVDGNLFFTLTGGVIGLSGTVTLPFVCAANGPIPCPAGSLAAYQAIPGIDSVSNLTDGVAGTNTESRAAFEVRRAASVALNAVGVLPAVLAKVLSVAGVLDAKAVENPTGATVTINGVSVVARSIYVSVAGGADADVAQAIWSKKSPGCAYNGNTTVTIQDTSPPYTAPFPSYPVTFQRPASLPFFIAVTIANSPAVPSNALALIQGVVAAAFSGADGGSRARIGSVTYASRFYAGVASLGAWASIVSIGIGTAASPTGTSVTTNLDKVPTLPPANITLSLV